MMVMMMMLMMMLMLLLMMVMMMLALIIVSDRATTEGLGDCCPVVSIIDLLIHSNSSENIREL